MGHFSLYGEKIMFAAIVALIKAIPALKDLWDQLVSFYITTEMNNLKQENRNAILQALIQHDQRAVERALNSPSAGKPSGDAGAVIVDNPPPGVH